ncbi:MAG: metal-binding protein, partial [Aeoliella sp.]
VVMFECFSADQSSYGCLTANRDDAFDASGDLQLGTTNVDYSWALYDHFQTLRTYRETRLRVDPSGVELATSTAPDYREEKIELPEGWLRGFMQIQSAMTLPMRRLTLSRDALYSIIAWYKRHKPRKSPRAMRFELVEGKSPAVVLEPWEKRIESRGTTYNGPSGEPTRVWGARRVLALARVLPLVESCDVYLLGTGLPSFWVANLGEMRITLGLSGWTANDWSRGSSLDLLAPPGETRRARMDTASNLLKNGRAERFDRLQAAMICSPGDTAATLNRLANSGQVMYDLAAGVYRWRQIMPMPLGEAELGPESLELLASREILSERNIQVESQTDVSGGGTLLVGTVLGKQVELALDRDGVVRRGKCTCSHHFKSGIRRGPCRHLLALRAAALGLGSDKNDSAVTWYNRIKRWSEN